MSVFSLTARRTAGQARNAYGTAFVVAAFVSAAIGAFAFALEANDGGSLSLPVVWAMSTSPVLPVLAALLGMDTWSEERRTGRMDILLSSPVSEWSLVAGKFFGIWCLLLSTLAVELAVSIGLLTYFAPDLPLSCGGFAIAYAALALQGALWCAVASATSALFRSSALSALASASVMVALPRGLWIAARAWVPAGGIALGEMPVDAHAIDMASGLFAFSTVFSYLLLTFLALFAATLLVMRGRMAGERARWSRAGAASLLLPVGVIAVLAIVFAMRIDFSVDCLSDGRRRYSERTAGILAETRGDLTVTCFLSRTDVKFRPLSRSLRAMARMAVQRGGAGISLRFVDPAWDVGAASRLVRAGVAPGSVLIEHGRRRAVLPVADGIDERLFASTVLSLTMPPQRRNVYWTRGHGEASFEDYGIGGLSDIARELARDGYLNRFVDLDSDATLPSDCALVVIAGSRMDFSRAESARIDAYLQQGGRLLVLLNSGEAGGISSLLSGWGVRIDGAAGMPRTLSGDDAIVTDFSEHPVTSPLRGTAIVLERPIAFSPSAAASVGKSADGIVFTPLATCAGSCVAAVAERGLQAGDDINLRPTRLVAVGDVSFVMNGQLAARANANRDFFLNAVAYLSGSGAMTSGGVGGDVLALGMDRSARRMLLVVGAGAVPVVLALLLSAVTFRRRRRS